MSENNTDLDLTIKQIIDKYSLLGNKGRSKALGQNFICDYSLLKKIASCAAPFNTNADILEIGPGPGGLTRAIVEISPFESQVFCIEKDRALMEAHENLQKCCDHDRLKFIYEDALDIKIEGITKRPVFIISNLPYNVGTQLLISWLNNLTQIEKMVLLFQKEVANRIVARPGTKEYGRLSVISQLLCKCEKIFDISNKAFYPAPKVISSLVKLTPKKEANINISELEKITAICFQQRRKTIFSSMKNCYDQSLLIKVFDQCGINRTDRPEVLEPEQFLQLQRLLSTV